MSTSTRQGLTLSSPWAGLSYGAMGFPLAFVALPLYVVLPNHYATQFGVPLAALGTLLLLVRLLDAVVDPWIGHRMDAAFQRGTATVLMACAAAALVLAIGLQALFFPWVQGPDALLLWCAGCLVFTYGGYSVLSVAHQAWGARLGGDAAQRTRIVAWREALALLGVLVASALPALAGLQTLCIVFAAALLAGCWLLGKAPRATEPTGSNSTNSAGTPPASASSVNPWSDAAFQRLITVFLLNGVASAIPATLVLFFIRDRLKLPGWEPIFLVIYFLAGALSMPVWVKAVSRWGLARLWLTGMLMAVAAFVWAAALGDGDQLAYSVVCLLSGLALGADLALPGALLAGVIQRAGMQAQGAGAYFGWWNFATKLNLALAAGLSLPLLQWMGYEPGARDDASLKALSLAYCLLPCALKLLAAASLIQVWMRFEQGEP